MQECAVSAICHALASPPAYLLNDTLLNEVLAEVIPVLGVFCWEMRLLFAASTVTGTNYYRCSATVRSSRSTGTGASLLLVFVPGLFALNLGRVLLKSPYISWCDARYGGA